MISVLVYSCRVCGQSLPLYEAYISEGALVAKCEKCQQPRVLDSNPLCVVCPSHNANPAVSVIMFIGEVTHPSYRCDLHSEGATIRCLECSRELDYLQLVLIGQDLVLVCPDCHENRVLYRSARCDICYAPATNLRVLRGFWAPQYDGNRVQPLCERHKRFWSRFWATPSSRMTDWPKF